MFNYFHEVLKRFGIDPNGDNIEYLTNTSIYGDDEQAALITNADGTATIILEADESRHEYSNSDKAYNKLRRAGFVF